MSQNTNQAALCPIPKRSSATRASVASAIPAWLSPVVAAELAAYISGNKAPIRFRFSQGERKTLRRRKMIPVSEWAERHRIVEMSSIPGKWKNLFTPYLVGIMDAAGTPGVETVIVCKSPQTGDSEAGHNLVGWCIDRCPGPVMYVFPDEITARENAKDRIIPMIIGSPRLREYMTSYGDDASSLRVNLAHMPIYLGWSGSVSRLGNKPIRTLILDELDKYKNPKNEATSEKLAELRTTTWRERKHILKISTPTIEDGPIWTAFMREAGARFDFWVRCAHCNIMQLMSFDRISWPGKDNNSLSRHPRAGGDPVRSDLDSHVIPAKAGTQFRSETTLRGNDGEEPIANFPVNEPSAEETLARRLAFYPCEHCGAVWDDGDRDRAVRRGEWRERASGLDLKSHLAAHRPVKVGFHIPAWLSFFVSLSEVASAAIQYKTTGKLDDLKTLQNQYKAEPWREDHAARSEDSILALCDDRPRGVVPGHVIPNPSPVLRHPREGGGPESNSLDSRLRGNDEKRRGNDERRRGNDEKRCGNDERRVSAILAGIDTQKGYFRYVIRAFGYGDTEESWLIQAGSAPSFSALNELLWQSTYRDANGHEYKVRAAMIDAMGGRTKEVYSWALRHRGRVFPWQGVRSLSQPYTPAPQEYFPDVKGNKIKIPGGLNLWRCDTTFFKSDLSHKLSIAPDDPGAFHLHSNSGAQLEQYAREMCAEVWDDEKQAWDNPANKPNHFWDCETMCLALAFILNVRHLKPEADAAPARRPVLQQPMPVRSVADRLAGIRR